jgi:hypothetical protein
VLRNLDGSKRVWLPFAGAALLLLASYFTGGLLTWLLLLAAVVLIFDGATLLWSRGGGLSQNRQ